MKKKNTVKKLKLYKTIIVTGKEWDLFLDPSRHGGEFSSEYKDTGRGRIVVGTKAGKMAALSTLIHELFEAELACACLRYDDPDHPAEYVFVFRHGDLTKVCLAIAQALHGAAVNTTKFGE